MNAIRKSVLIFLLPMPLFPAHALRPVHFLFDARSNSSVTGNSVVDLRAAGSGVWAATSGGISHTADRGLSWKNITRANGLGYGGLSALDIRDGVIWAATGFDSLTPVDTSPLDAGGGVGYSADGGDTWTWFPQPVDSRDETSYKPTTTNVQNITYGLALTDEGVWIASFGGGLRRSTDSGRTWQVVTVDGLPFDAYGRLTHRVFSVHFDGRTLWAGTAGGVHKSTDGGSTWITYSHQNQQLGISGNFVVAIGTQNIENRSVVWAATWETTIESNDSTEFKAVSFSEDGGLTWATALKGESVHNFAFDGSDVYAASDNGLFKSVDGGKTWAVFPLIVDQSGGAAVYSQNVNCAAADADRALWAGTDDGLAMTADGGGTWRVFRAFRPTGNAGGPMTYAYPNPFSPLRHNLAGGDGHVRFQYHTAHPTRVTVRVYDFGMNLVSTAVRGKDIPSPGDHAEVWNGKNDVGDMVANGVYFYKLEIEGEGTHWGKVMVVN
jgi:photosystem II stability/assembly factor-like uncharacterized protein